MTDFNALFAGSDPAVVEAVLEAVRAEGTHHSAITADAPRLNLQSSASVRDQPVPEFLIDGVLPVGALFQVFGQTGEYKSFVMLDMAMSVANGISWMGHPVNRQGLVALVLGEGGADAGLRIAAWMEGHPGYSDALAVYSIEEQLDLMSPGQVDTIISDLHEYRAANHPDRDWQLVVFDTQADHMPSGDEDRARDFTLVKRAIQRIRQQTGAAVGLVHHTGWDKSRERGSSRQRQALDVVIQIEDMQITSKKQKFAADFSTIRFDTVAAGASLYVKQRTAHDDLSAAYVKDAAALDADVRRLLEVISENPGISVTSIKKTLKIGHSKFDQLREIAVERRYLHDHEGSKGTASVLTVTDDGASWLALG